MSFINGNNNQNINNRNNYYYFRHGNNYQSPFKINDTILNKEQNKYNNQNNIQNNIQNNFPNNNLDYINTLNKFETNQKYNYENNNNNYSNIPSRNNRINNYGMNNFNYRNYNPYEPFDINKIKRPKRYDNFHYLEQNNNNIPQTEIKNNNNNNFDINTIGKIILSTETMDSNDKLNKNKAQREYSDYLKQQSEEKNKRKKLEREKEMEEDLRLEQQNKEYLKRQKEEMEKEKLKRKNNLFDFNSEKKPENNESKKFLIDTDINKNLMENIKRAQTPLISDHIKLNKEISDKYSGNKNGFEINDIYKNFNVNNNSSRRPVSSTIIQSGKGIIDGRTTNNVNNINNISNNIIKESNEKNNLNNNINFEKNDINSYPKYNYENLYPEIKEEENTIKNNKYMNYNLSKRSNINNINTINNTINNNNIRTNGINNFNETLFNREKYDLNFNINNSSFNNINANINSNTNINNNTNKYNNYDVTFKPKEQNEENNYIINESLKGSIKNILDLNNNIEISRSFENEKNKQENNNINNNNENLFVTFGPINAANNTQSNKGNYQSINSNFTFGNNSQLPNKNLFGVDSIIKNINVQALNYYSKYENNDGENNNKNEDNNNKEKEYNLEQSMRSVSKLISASNKENLFTSWKNNSIKPNESIKEEINNENENQKEFTLNNNINDNKNDNYLITFGEIPKDTAKINIEEKNDTLNQTLKRGEINDFQKTNKNLEEENLETEGICNFYKLTKKIKNEEFSNKVDEALKDAKESSDEDENNLKKINNKLNFFEDTIGKIKKKTKNDIINNNDKEQLDLIISGELEDLDTFKSVKSNKKRNSNSNSYDENEFEDFNNDL